jgi:uncharacterized membrane protein
VTAALDAKGERRKRSAGRLCGQTNDATVETMFNLVSLIIGFVALVCALIAFIPLLGWANWLIVPLAIIGAGIGMISRGTAGRNLNLFVIVIGIVRLMLGGGII